MLSKGDKKALLKIARQAIEAAVQEKGYDLSPDIPDRLREPCGAFVTLRKGGDLRGCIGYIEGISPLAETVRDAAQKAANEDYRFTPVTYGELPVLEIEISVLSPLKRIESVNEIEIGKHGIILEYQRNRGLLLPQVATENGWDRETFLNQTARKAGLSPESWQNPEAKIFIFSAEIFSEQELK